MNLQLHTFCLSVVNLVRAVMMLCIIMIYRGFLGGEGGGGVNVAL